MPDLMPMHRFDWERAIQRADLPRSVKGTALMFATFADQDGTRVRPGWRIMSDVCGMGHATYSRHLQQLKSAGYIERTKQGNRHRNEADEYRLTVPKDFTKVAILDPDYVRRPKSGAHVQSSPDETQTSEDLDESGAHPDMSGAHFEQVWSSSGELPPTTTPTTTNHNVTSVKVSHDRVNRVEQQTSIRPGDPSYQPMNTAYAAFRAKLMERRTS